MKPYEEKWAAKGIRILCGDHEQAAVFSSDLPGLGVSDHDDARARLAAQAPAMARLLLRIRAVANDSDAWWMTDVNRGGIDVDAIEAVLRDAGVI